jgi:uncharacterized protein with HEPN domain
MASKDNSVYIDHMLDCIARIYEYASGEDDFRRSRLVQDAVLRNLQTLAESSQRLPDPLKDQYPEIPWRNISGFRNILVYDYLGIDLDVIWSVVEMELPKLVPVLEELRSES